MATNKNLSARKTSVNQVPRKGDLVYLFGDQGMDMLPYIFVPAPGIVETSTEPVATKNGLYYPLKEWWSTNSSNSPSSSKHQSRLIQTSTTVPNMTVVLLLEEFPEDPIFNVVEIMYFGGIALALTHQIQSFVHSK